MHSARHPIRRLVAATTLVVVSAAGFTACDGGGTGQARRDTTPDPSSVEATPPTTASPLGDDVAAIAFMREEEKLARDVYTVLGEAWGLPIFTNITASEQQHMDAVGGLLAAYAIVDPAATTAPGEFVDPTLQALYAELVTRGLTSLDDALRVGVSIEETDIADLAARASTDPTVQTVWDHLMAGSENHLRAFSSQLDRIGA